ncbi:unnamed protein product [Vitrella brassicaformis CCMP3155]|uniref:Cilia- and flagella-associated protein 53 n=1 Tax=Vitrella brassicaformis (strain CCMP3155) TaxID=1169540 RepID=A0A0G4EN75_VITBC|nr:unnamed protein product [Vitrella brassicaformis CCMP3155]|mmetsp:Transcript_18484/g.44508  ORF Transcript_18484/g.44508 Transcript_18484/m.44508 type:complete len:488 (-) Transcript_18484:162-1625(-)|eukprot:CEL98571.1 unnamed protein product [Vitrella brassicaformis CCMP3155]
MLTAKCRSDYLISRRRQQEDRHLSLCKDVHSLNTAQQKAEWEQKSDGVIATKRIESLSKAKQATHRQNLVDRQQRLINLLESERLAYEAELRNREETPDQRRQAMANRALALKAKREQERQGIVNAKLYQQFREAQDELRTEDSKLFELNVLATRDEQINHKNRARLKEKEDDKVYDALWQQEYHKKVDREDRDFQETVKRNEETKAVLSQQLQLTELRKQDAAKEQQEEGRRLKEQLVQEKEEAERRVVEEAKRNFQKRKELDEFILQQQGNAQRRDAEERRLDKEYLELALAKEREMADREKEERRLRQQQNDEFRRALVEDMQRKAESEEVLIRMQEEESERQWEKRQQQWDLDKARRNELLRQVFEGRAQQVCDKTAARDQIKQDIHNERGFMEAEARRLAAIEEERQRTEKQLRDRHAEELFRQMDFHQVQRARDMQMRGLEKRQSELAERELSRALQTERIKQEEIKRVLKANREQRQADQ